MNQRWIYVEFGGGTVFEFPALGPSAGQPGEPAFGNPAFGQQFPARVPVVALGHVVWQVIRLPARGQ